MSTKLFSKFQRPEQSRRGIITARDLALIEAILRYRFSPTSELVRLVGGNEDVTQRRLRALWEWGHINRFAFPGIRTHSEFHYYLDNRRAVEVVVERDRLADIHPQMLEELRNHVAKSLGPIAKPRQIMLVPELPKTRSGKIMRRLLRDVAENRSLGDVTTLQDSAVMDLIQSGMQSAKSED